MGEGAQKDKLSLKEIPEVPSLGGGALGATGPGHPHSASHVPPARGRCCPPHLPASPQRSRLSTQRGR